LIDQLTLKSIYNLLSLNSDRINTSVIKDTNEEIRWVFVFNIDGLQGDVGITQYGQWGVNCPGNFCILDRYESLLYFIYLLEAPFEDIQKKLRSGLENDIERIDFNGIFPFFEIVMFVFEYKVSDYWINLAFEWYNHFLFLEKKSLKEAIERLSISHITSQKTRHRAKKALKVLKELEAEYERSFVCR